ncbi:mucin-5AC-like isoform X3 [Dermacentor silvarum]|uniref:mucin-5AC-like isoform X3 n=1 Tax=Dermacentor silvarum TaxID=543639 RepID=UPI002100D1E3|nr:mucin-5AC-like isoform X3 [Dermacentor silvarum]
MVPGLRLAACIFLLTGAAATAQKPNFYTFCFWDGFSRWRPEPYKSTVRDIPAELCNAVVYSHVTVNEKNGWIKLTDKELTLDPEAKSDANSFFYNPIWLLPPHRVFAQLRGLKDRNPKLKLLLAVGGPHDPVEKYWQLFPEVHLWKDMTESLAQWLNTYDFDGVVLDFFSGSASLQDSTRSWDNARYIHPFVRQINYGLTEHRKNWTITFTLPVFDSTTHHLFDIEKLTQEVNFFLVKTSDCLEFPKGAFLNVTRTMDMTDIDRAELIVEKGAPRQRIVLDIPLSGRTYTAVAATSSGVHTVFPGHSGPYTKLQGFLAFFELCSHIKNGWKRERFGEEACSFLKQADEYVAYEDDDSIRRKARMVMGRQYRGAAVRSVDLGDYTGSCEQKSHLLKALRSTLDITDYYVHFYYDPPNTTWWEEVQRQRKNATTEPPPVAKHSTATAATAGPTTQAASTTESLMSRALREGGRFLWDLVGKQFGTNSGSNTPGQAAPPTTQAFIPSATVEHSTTTAATPGATTQAASTTDSLMSRALREGGRFLWDLVGKQFGTNSGSNTPGQAAPPTTQAFIPSTTVEHSTTTAATPGSTTQAASTTDSLMSRALQEGGRFLWDLLGKQFGANSGSSPPSQAAPPTTQAFIPSATVEHSTTTAATPGATTQAASTNSLMSRALQEGGRFLWDLLKKQLGTNSDSTTPGKAAPPTTQAFIPSATEEHSTTTAATPGATTQAASTTDSLMSRALQEGGRFLLDLIGKQFGTNSGSNTPGQAAPPTTQAFIPSATEEHSTTTAATPGATTQAASTTDSLMSRVTQGPAAPPTTQAFIPSPTEEHSTTTAATPGATTQTASTTDSLMSRAHQDGGRFRWDLLGEQFRTHSGSSIPGQAAPPTAQPTTSTDKSSDALFVTAPGPSTTPTKSPTPEVRTLPAPPTTPSVPSETEVEASSAQATTLSEPPTAKVQTSFAPPTKPSDRPTPVVVPVTMKNEGDLCKGVKSHKLLPHNSDCAKYYQCVHSSPILRTCAQSTIFDIERQTCNWPALANRPECL